MTSECHLRYAANNPQSVQLEGRKVHTTEDTRERAEHGRESENQQCRVVPGDTGAAAYVLVTSTVFRK